MNVVNIDRFDRAILRLVQRDSSLTNSEIGERIGLSSSACSRRIAIMQKNGIISGYNATINPAVIGIKMNVLVQVQLEAQDDKHLREFEKAVQRVQNVVSCHLISGEFDYQIVVAIRDIDEYEKIYRNSLSSLPGVCRLQTIVAFREVFRRAVPV